MSSGAAHSPSSVRGRGERAAVTMLFAALGLALLMATGLAVDGGRRLGALAEARDLADNAARAGAQAIDENAYRASGTPTLDPAEAEARALGYLEVLGHTGTVDAVGNRLTVTVTVTPDAVFLPIDMSVTATETAQAVIGIEEAR